MIVCVCLCLHIYINWCVGYWIIICFPIPFNLVFAFVRISPWFYLHFDYRYLPSFYHKYVVTCEFLIFFMASISQFHCNFELRRSLPVLSTIKFLTMMEYSVKRKLRTLVLFLRKFIRNRNLFPVIFQVDLFAALFL